MSSEEMNQSSRREFLARIAKTGALVAPVIATFSLTSNSPVQARGGWLAGGGNQGYFDWGLPEGYRKPMPEGETPAVDLPDTK